MSKNESELTFWQRTAKKTHGVITPANTLSLAGWVLADTGARNMELKKGIAMFVAGETCDLLDGLVARKTDTVSDFGKILDTTADKFKLLRVLKEAEKRGIVNSEKADYIIARNSINVALAGVSLIRGRDHETNKPGKRAMFLEVTSVAADIIAHKLEQSGRPRLGKIAKTVGCLSLGASIPFGIKAAAGYAETAISDKTKDD